MVNAFDHKKHIFLNNQQGMARPTFIDLDIDEYD